MAKVQTEYSVSIDERARFSFTVDIWPSASQLDMKPFRRVSAASVGFVIALHALHCWHVNLYSKLSNAYGSYSLLSGRVHMDNIDFPMFSNAVCYEPSHVRAVSRFLQFSVSCHIQM